MNAATAAIPTTASTNLLALAAGVLAHLGIFIHGEWHMRGPYVLILHVLLALGGYWVQSQVNHVPAPALTVVLAAASYLTGLFGSIVIYRLFFHRLRKFPGPMMARVTKLWHVYHNLDTKNFRLLDRLYEEYGPIVRIGPNEVAIYHPDAIQLIEGTSKCWRPDYDDIISPDASVAFERDPQLHAARRQVWNRATNKKVLPSYYPRLQRQVEVLEHKIEEASVANKPVFVNDLVGFWAWDSMGEFAFNQDFGMLQSGEWHASVDMIRRATSLLGVMKSVIWLIRLGLFFVPNLGLIGGWNKAMEFCRQRVVDRIKEKKPDEPDVAQFFIDQAEKEGYTESAWKWLRGDAPALVFGGSDTTTLTVTMLLYAMAKYSHHQDLVYDEVADIDPYELAVVEKLPHLNATITETMRLWPAAASTIIRITPPEGLTVGGTHIPGSVHTTAPRWTNFRDDLSFPRGKEFIPERWTSQPELVVNRSSFFPFGAGRTMCPGQGIAWAQIRMVLASIVKNYKICAVDGESLDRVETDLRDELTLKAGKLVLRFEKRKA